MTSSPRKGAVPGAGDVGSGWVAFAVVGIFVSFFSIGAYPIWSVIALVTNGLVLWAVTAHGDEFDG